MEEFFARFACPQTLEGSAQSTISRRDNMPELPEPAARRYPIVRQFVVRACTVFAALAVLAPRAATAAEDGHWPLRSQDSVWLVSSRGLGCFNPAAQVERLRYWRFDEDRAWTRSQLSELVDPAQKQPTTVVFLHGNRVASCDAFNTGWRAYRRLVGCADERPIRFVVWSWPSAKICGPVKDVRIKAARANAHGYYVAWFVNRIDRGKAPVGLWGFSYGARVATGALHLLGGGVLNGRRLDLSADAPRTPMRAALLAAAVDDDWLLPARRHGDAWSPLGNLLLVNNGCDRVLARYHWIYGRRCCQEALGYVGLPVGRLPAEDARKVSQINACCYVGDQHAFASYLASSSVMARVRGALLEAALTDGEPDGIELADEAQQLELVVP